MTTKKPTALSTREAICRAIENRQRVQFIYNSKIRIAEPQCCGLGNRNNELARFHLIEGGSRPEQLFELSAIESLKVLDEHFTEPGPNYKRDDSAMKQIYCQL